MTEQEKKLSIMRNAYMKLDGLPLGFGIPKYDPDIPDDVVSKYFGIDLLDTTRETRINVADIEDNSADEMQFENRVVYHALRRYRMTASIYFKFSTAVDGKTIDKSMIPKMMQQIISEYDAEFKKWKSGNCGKIWQRSTS